MLTDMISLNRIAVNVACKNKNEAIKAAGKLLLKDDYIKEPYIQSMVELSEELNAYIVLIPKVAMPHARPEDGALKTGFSIVTLKDPVCFGNKKNDPVYLVIGLSAVDNIIHLKTMKQLSRLLCDDDMVNNIIKSQSCEELYKYIEDFEKKTLKC
mgnify:CR=1 FL=1